MGSYPYLDCSRFVKLAGPCPGLFLAIISPPQRCGCSKALEGQVAGMTTGENYFRDVQGDSQARKLLSS